MGSVLSLFQIPEQAEKEPITDEDFFYDAEADMTSETNSKDLHTDAVEAASIKPHINPINSRITFATVKDIEKELSLYEKVSLVFLLYEQEDIALQSLLVERENLNYNTSIHLISNWAQSKHTSEISWQDKFIEALCVIQNYALLQRLGYDKNDMRDTYLPTNAYTSIYIDNIRKTLYCLCESLTADQSRVFLSKLKSDFQGKDIALQDFDEHFLEINLLHCFSTKYIKSNDLSNLTSLLKKLKMHSQAEMVDSVAYHLARRSNCVAAPEIEDEPGRNIPKFDLNTKISNVNANGSSGTCSDNSVIGDNSIVNMVIEDDVYRIDPKNVGICLIINQVSFVKDKDPKEQLRVSIEPLHTRKGSEFDEEKLSDTFRMLGFRIIRRSNLTSDQMTQCIEETMGVFKTKDSCFVVCILSHGYESAVYGSNSIPVTISDIEDIIHNRRYRALLGKPKILIIQSCQGKPLQEVVRSVESNYVTDGPTENTNDRFNFTYIDSGIPEKRDLLLCMSTVSGYASVRDEKQGSWFIQEFCNQINLQCDRNHMLDIMTSVINKVSNKRWHKNNGVVSMVPETRYTLSKKLFLPKIKNNFESEFK